MTDTRVAAFTDTYLPTVNGVTYTVETWRDQWEERGGRMDVVYPDSDYDPGAREHPVRSLPFPFYDGFRVGVPTLPDDLASADVVHAHTPFGVGVGGMRLARAQDLPLVASYHTPTSEYASYLSVNGTVEKTVRRVANRYEQWYLERADRIVVPSPSTAERVRESVVVSTPVCVVPNGVDTDFFRPVDDGFRSRYGLPDKPLVGYTGRHGYEKNLDLLIEAVAAMDRDVALAFGGDGPAREDLERAADRAAVEAYFLGFLDREELPAFYSCLDVFGFPSTIETQGLVALEATACGTPVAGVSVGALCDTIRDGENGYAAPTAERAPFRDVLERTLDEREELGQNCLDQREQVGVDHAMDRLASVYEAVTG